MFLYRNFIITRGVALWVRKRFALQKKNTSFSMLISRKCRNCSLENITLVMLQELGCIIKTLPMNSKDWIWVLALCADRVDACVATQYHVPNFDMLETSSAA